jgi:thiol-disulfide isomerase/thioredoxin
MYKSSYGNINTYQKDEIKDEESLTMDLQMLNPNFNNVLDQFNLLYLDKTPIVVVKIWAPWCEPCKLSTKNLNQLILEIQHEYPLLFHNMPQILFLDDNIDNENSIHKTKINAIPSFYIYSSINNENVLQSFTNVDFNEFKNSLKYLCQILYEQGQYYQKTADFHKEQASINYH